MHVHGLCALCCILVYTRGGGGGGVLASLGRVNGAHRTRERWIIRPMYVRAVEFSVAATVLCVAAKFAL